MKTAFFVFLLFLPFTMMAQSANFEIRIDTLQKDFYVHTSYGLYKNVAVPANGLIVNTRVGILLIDTPWDEDQTRQLMQWIEKNTGKKIVRCIVTHSHEDRLGGADLLKQAGVEVISTALTEELARLDSVPVPDGILPADTSFTIGGKKVRTYYPGHGHSRDNIVVWFPKQKILFGGCFVKSIETTDMGNLGSANLKEWPIALQNVMASFPNAKLIIPGHQGWSTRKNALQHTLDLLKSNSQ